MNTGKSSIIYRVAFAFCWVVFSAMARLKVEGREHVPEGAAILAPNHLSGWDLLALGLALPKFELWAMGKKELFDSLWTRWLFAGLGGIPVNRGTADRQALLLCKQVLEHGEKLIVLPEGTRSRTGGLNEGKMGVVLVAQLANAPVIPTAIIGTRPMGMPWHRARVTVRFGEPVTIEKAQRSQASRQAALNTIMYRIAAMLPAKMRGFYE